MIGIAARAALSFIALTLAACGGGGGGGGSGTPSTPPAATPNRAPIVIASARSLRVVQNYPLDYDVLSDGPLFSDPDGDPLTYKLSWFTRLSSEPDVWENIRVSGTRVEGTTTRTWTNQVVIEADDGRGGAAKYQLELVAGLNRVPVVRKANPNKIIQAGENVQLDVTQGGAAFDDGDADPLFYSVSISPPHAGLRVEGTNVIGSLGSVGATRVTVKASDRFGGSVSDSFVIAVPTTAVARPTLPTTSFVYDDVLLQWPEIFRLSREITIPFFDTTPPDNPTTNAGATLGRVLFYDKRLSITNTHACGSCHEQARGFTVGTAFAEGVTGELSHRNPMALTNIRYNNTGRLFGDGRAATLETLALMPIEDPMELGNDVPDLIGKLASTDFYPPMFAAAFGTPDVTGERIAFALSQFLRSIISYRSKFDAAYLSVYPISEARPETVLTPQELLGREMFVSGACHFCHDGHTHVAVLISNNGLDAQSTDPGAGNGEFRAGPLRNIAVSAPYMHDGRFATLRQVIDHYDSGVQFSSNLHFLLTTNSGTARRLNMTEEQKLALEVFLNTLTDASLLQDAKFSDPFPAE